MPPLTRAFYDRNTVTVARDLLGKTLIHMVDDVARQGKIVETEADLGPHDKASHSARGRTTRNEVMFGPPGHAYVYFIYGMHYCFNVVTEREGHASAILIRAIEPLEGITDRTCGPGLLCRAMGIGKQQNGVDLCGTELFITEPANTEQHVIVNRPRIGVDYAGHWARRLLRFYIKSNAFVSKR